MPINFLNTGELQIDVVNDYRACEIHVTLN